MVVTKHLFAAQRCVTFGTFSHKPWREKRFNRQLLVVITQVTRLLSWLYAELRQYQPESDCYPEPFIAESIQVRRSRTIAVLSGSQASALFLLQCCFMRRLTVIYWQADFKSRIRMVVAGCWRGDMFQTVLCTSEWSNKTYLPAASLGCITAFRSLILIQE